MAVKPRAVLLVAMLLVVPGCITIDGPGTLQVQVLVTEDVGTHVLKQADVTLPTGSTVLDALREIAVVETAYGGGFVEAIDGRESGYPDEQVDWFYHVDTRLGSVGAGDRALSDGELVLWDHRPWNRTMGLPHVLTGLDQWPAALAESTLQGPEAVETHEDAMLYVRVDGEALVALDPWGVAAERIEPPWLLVHAIQAPGQGPGILLVASGAHAQELTDELPGHKPTGVGLVLTPQGAHEVPG